MTVWCNSVRKLVRYAFCFRFLSHHIKKSNNPGIYIYKKCVGVSEEEEEGTKWAQYSQYPLQGAWYVSEADLDPPNKPSH